MRAMPSPRPSVVARHDPRSSAVPDVGPQPRVDTGRRPSVSFAPPEPPTRGRGPPRGPGRPSIVAPVHERGGLLGAMPEYPVQISKVQAPPLRDETLERVRL